ncbi:MAG: hypothetical protein ACKOX3_12460 [Bacteroidota bacterium]
MKNTVTTLFLCLFGLSHIQLKAQDRVFARTYQSNVLAKGNFDIEFWSTLRSGKTGENTNYLLGRRMDQRLELEFGLGKNVQTAFYLNYSKGIYISTINDTSALTELKQNTSISNEWKFKLSDPVANVIGTALYFELEAGPDEYEIESKIILDKKIDKHLFACNIISEVEFESEIELENGRLKKEMEIETPLELTAGYMYFLKPWLGIGAEVRNYNGISKEDGWEYSALFGGPTLFFSQGRLFGTLNLAPQFSNLHRTDHEDGKLVLNDLEKSECRLIIGYSF